MAMPTILWFLLEPQYLCCSYKYKYVIDHLISFVNETTLTKCILVLEGHVHAMLFFVCKMVLVLVFFWGCLTPHLTP